MDELRIGHRTEGEGCRDPLWVPRGCGGALWALWASSSVGACNTGSAPLHPPTPLPPALPHPLSPLLFGVTVFTSRLPKVLMKVVGNPPCPNRTPPTGFVRAISIQQMAKYSRYSSSLLGTLSSTLLQPWGSPASKSESNRCPSRVASTALLALCLVAFPISSSLFFIFRGFSTHSRPIHSCTSMLKFQPSQVLVFCLQISSYVALQLNKSL